MTVVTEFEVGNKVYYMYNNKVNYGEIIGFKIEERGESQTIITTDYTIRCLSAPNAVVSRPDYETFGTKELLIASL